MGSEYSATVTKNHFQADELTLSIHFQDKSKLPFETLGACNLAFTLDSQEKSVICEMTLRRRAVAGGNLLAVLSINVFDRHDKPVLGAIISENGHVLGLTGSGTFGNQGYLTLFLIAGPHAIHAITPDQQYYGDGSITLEPLGIDNLDIFATE